MWKFIVITVIFHQYLAYAAVFEQNHEVAFNCIPNNGSTKETQHFDCSLMDVISSKNKVIVTSTNINIEKLKLDHKFTHIEVTGNENYPEYFPKDLAMTIKGVAFFYYTNTSLKFIKREDLTDFGADLQLLSLSDNKIGEISYDILYDLPNLLNLDVSNNYLKTLPPSLFANAPNFDTLFTGSNELTELHPDLFKNCSKFYLLYAQNNLIEEFPDDLLKNNPNMMVISMRHNRIKNISVNFTRFELLDAADFTHNAGTCDIMYFGSKPWDDWYDEADLKKWIKTLPEFQKKVEDVCKQ